MSQFTIDKGIPIPIKGRTGPQVEWPYGAMEVGDSFLVPGGKERSRTIAAAATRESIKTGAKFTQRVIGKDVRVWRTA